MVAVTAEDLAAASVAAAIWVAVLAVEVTLEALAAEATSVALAANTWAASAMDTSAPLGAHGFGLHQHASHRFGGYGPGYGYYSYPDCYDWYYLHPDQPLPLSCS